MRLNWPFQIKIKKDLETDEEVQCYNLYLSIYLHNLKRNYESIVGCNLHLSCLREE